MLDPADLVNFLFNLQALEIIKFWLVALEGAVDIVVASEDGRRALHWTALHVYVQVCACVCAKIECVCAKIECVCAH